MLLGRCFGKPLKRGLMGVMGFPVNLLELFRDLVPRESGRSKRLIFCPAVGCRRNDVARLHNCPAGIPQA